MATKRVLEEAISKLHYNTNVLREKRTKCSSKSKVNEIDKQISQIESMILDYQFRITHGTE